MEEELIEEVYDLDVPSALEAFFNYVLPTLPPIAMCLITLALVFVFLCAWKAPRWIKPVGSIALSVALISITWPYLTTFCQDAAAIAREAFSLMIDAVENPESHVTKHVTVSGMLIEGDTVK